MNWSYLIDAIPKFVDAAKLTLELSVYGVVLSLLFGLPVAVVTAYRIRPFYALARAYIELSRNTPLLIQLFSCITACRKWALNGTVSPAA